MNLLPLFFLFGNGCNRESTTDVAQRDRNREREKSEAVFNEYQLADGRYKGRTSLGDLFIDVKAGWSKSDSSTTPNATMVGRVVFFPMILAKGTDPLQSSFLISDGNYFSVSKTLTLTVGDGDTSSKMVCQKPEEGKLDCEWYTQRGQLSFNMSRMTEAESVSSTRAPGVYKGAIDDFTIEARFETRVSKNSILPAVNVTFFSKTLVRPDGSPHDTAFPFENGTYDFFKNSFSFVADGPLYLNCSISSASQLHCLWSGRKRYEFDLVAQPFP